MISRLFSIVAAATVALIVSGLVSTSPLLAMVVAGLVVFILPGALALRLSPATGELDPLEVVVYGAAASWCIVSILCVLAFVFHWRLADVSQMLVWGVAVLAVVAAIRPPQFIRAGGAARIVAAAVVSVGLLGFVIGGYTNQAAGPIVASGWSTMEEAFQISTVRKIVEADGLHIDRVVYVKGEVQTYLVPVYPFALALLAEVSGLDPLLVFDDLRLWTVVLSLLGLYALAKAVSGSRAAAATVTLVAVALAASGQAGQASGMGSWGQLVPLSHIGDFSLGVLLPITLAVVARFLAERTAGVFTVLAPLMLCALAITHTREVIHVLSYMGAALIVGPVLGAIRGRSWARLATLAVVTVIFLAAYSQLIMDRVPFIREHEAASAARIEVQTTTELHLGTAILIKSPDVPSAMQLIVSIGFLVAPAALLWFRHSAGMVFLVSGLLAWWVPMHIPLAGRLLERVSYSEVMMSPARYVFHAAYLLVGLIVFAAGVSLDRWIGERAWLRESFKPAASLAVVSVALLALAPVLGVFEELAGPALLTLGMLTAGWIAWGVPNPWPHLGARRGSLAGRPVLLVLLAVLGTALMSNRSTYPTMLQQAMRRDRPISMDLAKWYRQAPINMTLPWSTVQMLTRAVPKGAVIASDPVLGLAIPLITDHYVLASGTNFTTDLHYLNAVMPIIGRPFDADRDVDWSLYRRRLGDDISPALRARILQWESYYYMQTQLVVMGSPQSELVKLVRPVFESRPIFSESEPDAVTLRLLDTLKPDYLFADASRHRRLVAMMRANPERFENVATDGWNEVFRLR